MSVSTSRSLIDGVWRRLVGSVGCNGVCQQLRSEVSQLKPNKAFGEGFWRDLDLVEMAPGQWDCNWVSFGGDEGKADITRWIFHVEPALPELFYA